MYERFFQCIYSKFKRNHVINILVHIEILSVVVPSQLFYHLMVAQEVQRWAIALHGYTMTHTIILLMMNFRSTFRFIMLELV